MQVCSLPVVSQLASRQTFSFSNQFSLCKTDAISFLCTNWKLKCSRGAVSGDGNNIQLLGMLLYTVQQGNYKISRAFSRVSTLSSPHSDDDWVDLTSLRNADATA